MGMRKLLFLITVFLFFIQPCFAIKIGLQTDVNKTFIGASTKAEIIDCETNKLIFVMDKMKGYEFKAHKNIIAIKIDGDFKKINSNCVIIKPEEKGFVSVIIKLGKIILFCFYKYCIFTIFACNFM